MIDLGVVVEKLDAKHILSLFISRLVPARDIETSTLASLRTLREKSDTAHIFEGPLTAIAPDLGSDGGGAGHAVLMTYLRRVRYSIWDFEVR